MYVEVDDVEAWKASGKAPIGVRWVDVRNRQENSVVDWKSRVGDVEGLYAAMPPTELVKLVIAAAAERCRRVYFVKVMIDIKKAHLHAPIDGSVYVDLPPEGQKPVRCAKLKYTLYGMRQAARNWERECGKTLIDAGIVFGRANGSTFCHEMREVRIVVHGDVFVITGREEELKWMEDVLRKKHPLKMKGILGPEPGDSKEAPLSSTAPFAGEMIVSCLRQTEFMWKRFWKLQGWLTARRTPHRQRKRSTQSWTYHWRESSAKRIGRRWREPGTFRRTGRTVASRLKNWAGNRKPHSVGLEWAEEVVPVPQRMAEAGTRTC